MTCLLYIPWDGFHDHVHTTNMTLMALKNISLPGFYRMHSVQWIKNIQLGLIIEDSKFPVVATPLAFCVYNIPWFSLI